MARRGLPPAISQKLQAALAAALGAAGVQERLARLALVAAPATPAELTAQQKPESAFWGLVVKASGFTPED